MNGAQTLVGAGGVALVATNFWTGGQRGSVSAGLFGSGDPGVAHKALLTLGGEMIFVVVLTILAGLGDTWGAAMAVAIVGLWILWAINHYAPTSTSGTKSAQGGAA